MFQITQYLQYRNTPNGKPRVLVEGVDYHHTNQDGIWKYNREERCFYGVTDLKNTRPLLTVEIDGVELRSLMVRHSKEYPEVYQFLYFDGKSWNKAESYTTGNLSDKFLSYVIEDNLYFFESDPAKYSKLLWNCSEEEGWKKVFELLGIKL